VKREDIARYLLAACSARLHTDAGPQGTAFFVAPGFAVTAAHVIGGVNGLPVQLIEGPHSWRGHVADVRPPLASETATKSPYPAPDIALIKVDEGPEHACALLARQLPDTSARVMAYGYTRTLDELSVTAESESFRLTGMLETSDPGYPLLKLGLGEVTKGMSGAPILELRTGDVIGMLRTSRKLGSNFGGWVVPADLIRQLWPDEVSRGNDLFHAQDPRWRRVASQLRARMSSKDSTLAGNSPSIGTIVGDVTPIITGGDIGSVNIEYDRKGLSGDDRGD
jgi:Trypsin-like peptidase domain